MRTRAPAWGPGIVGPVPIHSRVGTTFGLRGQVPYAKHENETGRFYPGCAS